MNTILKKILYFLGFILALMLLMVIFAVVFGENGVFPFLISIVVIIYFYSSISKKRKRRAYLMEKYQNPEIVELILNNSFWQGQTSEQLFDSLGNPLDVDEKVYKTKTKEIWKYNNDGRDRYRLRITLENGFVVGWDQR